MCSICFSDRTCYFSPFDWSLATQAHVTTHTRTYIRTERDSAELLSRAPQSTVPQHDSTVHDDDENSVAFLRGGRGHGGGSAGRPINERMDGRTNLAVVPWRGKQLPTVKRWVVDVNVSTERPVKASLRNVDRSWRLVVGGLLGLVVGRGHELAL